jgi:hypothetical protein
LQTAIANLYAVGDGAGITRGLVQAAASGVVAARSILNGGPVSVTHADSAARAENNEAATPAPAAARRMRPPRKPGAPRSHPAPVKDS